MLTIHICDGDGGVLCRNCTGGQEGISLRGHKGWNYVLCEEIGIRVEIRMNNMEIEERNFTEFAICELQLFGINGGWVQQILKLQKISLST